MSIILIIVLLIPMFISCRKLWKLISLSLNGINAEGKIENLVYHEGYGGTEGYTEDSAYSFTIKFLVNGSFKSINCSQYSIINKEKIKILYDSKDPTGNHIFPEFASLELEFIRCLIGILILSVLMYFIFPIC